MNAPEPAAETHAPPESLESLITSGDRLRTMAPVVAMLASVAAAAFTLPAVAQTPGILGWLVAICVALAAFPVLLLPDPAAMGAVRRAGPVNAYRRRQMSVVLAIPALAIGATTAAFPSVWVQPVTAVFAVVGSLSAAFVLLLAWRLALSALDTKPALAAEAIRSAREFRRVAEQDRAKFARVAIGGSHHGLVLEHGALTLLFSRRLVLLAGTEGSVPQSSQSKLRESHSDLDLRFFSHGAVVVTGGSASARGRAIAEITALWSARHAPRPDEEDLPRRARNLANVPDGSGAMRWLRPTLALAAVAAAAAIIASGVVWYPVWEASWGTAVAVGLLASVAMAVRLGPAAIQDQRRVPDLVFDQFLREVHDLVWALGIVLGEDPAELSRAELARTTDGLDSAAGGGSLRCALLEGVDHRITAAIWRTDARPGEFGEWVEIRGGRRSSIEALLVSRSLPFVVRDDAIVLTGFRLVDSGAGPWRKLAWQFDDPDGIGATPPSPELCVPLPVSPTRQPVAAPRARRWWTPLACFGLVAIVGALPRVSAEAFPKPGNAEQAHAMVAQCPEAGDTIYESTLALRCLANGAGQSTRTLDNLDWTALLEPIARTLDALAILTRLSTFDGCGGLAETWSEMMASQQLQSASTLLDRYRDVLWKHLRFYWPDEVLRQRRMLSWEHVDDTLGGCVGALDDHVVDDVRRFYQLTGRTFEHVVEKSRR